MGNRLSVCLLLAVMTWLDMIGQKPTTAPAENLQIPPQQKIIIKVEQIPAYIYEPEQLPNTRKITGVTEISAIAFSDIGLNGEGMVNYKERVVNKKAEWVFRSDEPLFLSSAMFTGVVYPGDSVHINLTGHRPSFSGKGAEQLELYYELAEIRKIPSPTRANYNVNSLEEYLQWNRYADEQLFLIRQAMDSYRTRINASAFEVLKEIFVSLIEQNRIAAFQSFSSRAIRNKMVSINEVNEIFDSTLNKPDALWLRSLSDGCPSVLYYISYLRYEIYRQLAFNPDHDSLKSDGKRYWMYYQFSKRVFRGSIRENVLAYLIMNNVLKLEYTEPLREIMINDYYSQSKYPRFKESVQSYESYRNSRGSMVAGRSAHEFRFVDQRGKRHEKKDFNGKVVLFYFWLTGCDECIPVTKAVRRAQAFYKNDTSVVFINLSGDNEKKAWLKSIADGKYTTGKGINVLMGEQDYNMRKAFNITSFPKILLLNSYGMNARTGLDSLSKISGDQLIELIGQQLAIQRDGPYVFYDRDTVFTFSIDKSLIDGSRFVRPGRLALKAASDLSNRSFSIELKKSLNNEPSVYPKPEKLFALSDIEGNFDVFRKLLQRNGVIDENFNWTFGDGHLVFAGDMFDRGDQVTECLWLIYSFEEKAKKAGGYVHFILGNHEIMNMQGDDRYVQDKYKNNALLLRKSLKELYNETSELGRWLRTKNIMEKIGDILFVHGGITPEVNRLPLSITEMNDLARPYYAGNIDSSNRQLMTLFDTRHGEKNHISPLWSRAYYEDNVKQVITKQQFDSTLTKFDVGHVVTGHTIVGDTISVWYDGKVINTDTHHAEGKSEALLVKGNNYYRVDANGRKVLLFLSRKETPANLTK